MTVSNRSPQEPIMVTQTTLPPLDEYIAYLRKIWASHHLTNNGPFVRELEKLLKNYLSVSDLWFTNNCTTALQLALKAMDLRGEIITTPFSYVATTGVILWESCTPVFVDIRPSDLTIDTALLEAAITPRTSAILATHVYGFPCDVNAISRIAARYGLKVIYDAAHTFGCKLNGKSLVAYGDISCLSFHATKIFQTAEGGAVVVNGNAETSAKVRLMRAFGHHGDEHYCIGINGKNSELHAAMGLCNLPHLDATMAMRRKQHQYYTKLLSTHRLRMPFSNSENFEYNYAYFPVLLSDEAHLERVVSSLATHKIFPRRYFYPSLNRLPYLKSADCPIAQDVARRVLCLPMSEQVSPMIQEKIVDALIVTCRD